MRMPLNAIILAAGKGTRMKSDLPKVLHAVCGRPMLAWALDAVREAGCARPIVVIGHDAPRVRGEFEHMGPCVRWVEQSEQLGTGHAVMCCREELSAADGPVLVLAGDGPLVRAQTLRRLVDLHTESRAACTLATSVLDDPGHHGRIVRDGRGELAAIVEHMDATPAQRAIREVNVSLYCFDAAALREVLPLLRDENAKKEYYLTDALAILRDLGRKAQALPAVPADEVLSVNTPEELRAVEALLQARLSRGARGGSHAAAAAGGRL
jgi:bifunctional UDP-N-acetylglucosamine pyrophosphorylase / glucosamine-1-phosphate N-acetyltransferase